jgi:hypothetical protein
MPRLFSHKYAPVRFEAKFSAIIIAIATSYFEIYKQIK